MQQNDNFRLLHGGRAFCACVLAFGVVRADDGPRAGRDAVSTGGMVVSVSRPASEAGAKILKSGGNAVDAAIAVAFTLAVTWPEAGNIGGGGFMLVAPGAGREPVVIDYREMAPAAASSDMFANGVGSEARLVGVPGTLRGLERAHRKFATRPWRELVLPAAHLAEAGFAISRELAESLNEEVSKKSAPEEFVRIFGKNGGNEPWKEGDTFVQTDLANTLRKIALEGAGAFYSGSLAPLLIEEMKRSGGLITAADLARYEAKERTPIRGTFRGYDIYGAPPPSSGGICLVEMLNVAERLDLRQSPRWSPRTVHLMIETMRRAYCDRARFLGDPDFVAIPRHLTSKEYAETLARSVNVAKATPSESLAPELKLADEGNKTTHFSIIDSRGMAVSNTYTLEEEFGSKIVVRGAGYLLNNEMGDFNPRPGVTTRKGQIGTPPNLVAPGKRMLSSMCPVIVTRDDRVVLITGSPGGRTIINTVFCVLVNALKYDLPLREAVDAPRFHHQWFPDRVRVEDALVKERPDLLKELERMGHTVNRDHFQQGDAHSIWIDPTGRKRIGVADTRRGGWAAAE